MNSRTSSIGAGVSKMIVLPVAWVALPGGSESVPIRASVGSLPAWRLPKASSGFG